MTTGFRRTCCGIMVAMLFYHLHGSTGFSEEITDAEPVSAEIAQEDILPLTLGTVTIDYYDGKLPEQPAVSNSLAEMTEEELLDAAGDIYRGTVESLRTIEIRNGERTDYKTLAEISVAEVYKGGFAPGDTVTIYINDPILSENVWIEDYDVLYQMRENMDGIFMTQAGEDIYTVVGGEKIYLNTFADGRFQDGTRFAILAVEDGLEFARDCYEEPLRSAQTLEKAGEYLKQKIQ